MGLGLYKLVEAPLGFPIYAIIFFNSTLKCAFEDDINSLNDSYVSKQRLNIKADEKSSIDYIHLRDPVNKIKRILQHAIV